jgi:transcriptional regulator with XRE-family HTH domain
LRGWTLYELQLATGIQEPELSRIERGRVALKTRALFRLATAYQTDADRLAAEQERWLQRSRASVERRLLPPGSAPDGGTS